MTGRPKSRRGPPTGSTPRLAPAERERQIVDAAAALFSEKGFSASTRDLAKRLGVTQALIYRYFPSKGKLVDRVFEGVFGERWLSAWDALLADRSRPVEERLATFYAAYAGSFSDLRQRLFLRAGLDGLDFASRYSLPLTQRVLRPVASALREAADLPDLDTTPLIRGEREVAMMLHASVVFLGIRLHVYQMPLPADLSEHVELYVSTFLPGAVDSVRRLHTGQASSVMRARLPEAGG